MSLRFNRNRAFNCWRLLRARNVLAALSGMVYQKSIDAVHIQSGKPAQNTYVERFHG
jgi:hypothetical protein